MRRTPVLKLRATDSRMFRDDGEAGRMETFLETRCPWLSHAERKRVIRLIGYGIDLLGVDALNLAISDLETFQTRLARTRFEDAGYKAYLRTALKNATDFLHVAAHDGDGADVQALRARGGLNKRAAHGVGEPFAVTPRGKTRATTASASSKRRNAGAKSTNRRSQKTAAANGRPASRSTRRAAADRPARPTLGEIEAALTQLIDLQIRFAHVDQPKLREMIDLLLGFLDEAAMVALANEVPGGYRREVPADGQTATVFRAAYLGVRDTLEERYRHVTG